MPQWFRAQLLSSLRISNRAQTKLLIIFSTCLILVGCLQTKSTTDASRLQTVIPPSQTPAISMEPATSIPPIPIASPTQQNKLVWLPDYLPEKMQSEFSLPIGYTLTTSPEDADISLEQNDQDHPPDIQWIYVLVAPFPTVTDGVTLEVLQSAWVGEHSNTPIDAPLLMDESTMEVLNNYWGTPAPQSVMVLPSQELLDYAWTNTPSWAIIPFEDLNPQWKVLTIDGHSPVRKDFDSSMYSLTIPFKFSAEEDVKPDIFNLPITNRDASKMTTVAMTGVTAMVRATAYTMEQKGVTYPAQDIGPVLAGADITHISNEIPFSPDCPTPALTSEALVFCSNPDYIELLKEVGTDIIELTGDHFMDYGPEATLFTLQMYDDLDWPYFGGGANAEAARQPILLESNGNKLAFMGCNVGCIVKNEIPCNAIATDSHPGAAQCDMNWIVNEISTLRADGYQVIFTFQHREYYTYATESILTEDFGQVAAAGATIVSGSQAHQPHGFAFNNGAFIHFGLGNLFFDQFHFCADYACDDAFIDQHVFYEGQHISTELITIKFADFARPRLMTPEERTRFLEVIFTASGW